jgi:predicted nucleic acid-binding protein
VIDEAIRLRQLRKISLGDSIVAATAIARHLTLATHNTDDFSWISGLALIDPMA